MVFDAVQSRAPGPRRRDPGRGALRLRSAAADRQRQLPARTDAPRRWRLAEAGQAYRLVYLQEPGQLPRAARSLGGRGGGRRALVERLFPDSHERRVLLTHMRAEVARGHLWPILPDARRTSVLGYRNRGGTLDRGGHAVRQPRLLGQRCWRLAPA
ncbi:hypothetical protein ACPA9J_33230 [Pseudomonas aeruginosa]